MEFIYFFIFGLIVFIIGFLFYYPYHIKKIKKPELGIKKENKLDYLGDGFKLLFYHRSIAIMLMGIIIMIFTIIMFLVNLFK
jgi:Ca2+/Na+ antiporter